MSLLGRGLKIFVAAAVLFGLAFLVIIFNNRIAEQRQLVAQAEKLEGKLDAMRATEAKLIDQIAYVTSDAAVEAWAYQEARWIREGDQPIVPISPSESTPVEAPPPALEPVAYAPWQIWWALFFDDLPKTP
jgi:cell division protein FtsB